MTAIAYKATAQSVQISAAADRLTQHSASGPPCCTQMSTVSVQCYTLVTETVTSLPHWPSN